MERECVCIFGVEQRRRMDNKRFILIDWILSTDALYFFYLKLKSRASISIIFRCSKEKTMDNY